ncbi:MAG: T9SS type A sorting domain-containing protein, partial [Bacteroidetes bacterium]|nr:T9SS type A sorting domain-containing protein [Bacteroidota bacterium]
FYYDYTDQTWYYTTSNVMVRMNFDPNLVGIEESKDTQVSIYPNPAQDEILVHTSLTEGTLLVTDVSGRTKITQNLVGLTTSIDTSEWANGVYLLTITNGKETSVKKVVIKK